MNNTTSFEIEIKVIHRYLDSTVGVLSLCFNLSLLYLILNHSKFKVRAYKKILLTTCSVDLCLTVITLTGQPALFADHGYMVFVVNGFLAGRWEWFDHLCCTLYCSSVHINIVCVVCMFIYRYRVVCCSNGNEGRFKNLRQTFTIATLWACFQISNATCMYMLGQTDEYRKAALEMLDRYGWSYDHNRPPYPAVTHATQIKNMMHHVIYMISLSGGYYIIIWCEIQIVKFLHMHGSSINQKTRQMHAEVNRALIALAVTPTLTLMAPVFVVVLSLALQLTLGPSAAFISMTMSLITLANPLTTIFFVRPYRSAVLNLICYPFQKHKLATVHAQTGGTTGSNVQNSKSNSDRSPQPTSQLTQSTNPYSFSSHGTQLPPIRRENQETRVG